MDSEIVVLTKKDLVEMVRQTASSIVTELYDKLLPQQTREVMDKEQVAEYLIVSGHTIYRYMNRERDPLPFEMGRNGDHPRFRKADVDRWMRNEDSEMDSKESVLPPA